MKSMRDLMRIMEGDIVPFPRSPTRPVDAKPDEAMGTAMRSLRSFMADKRPVSQKFDVGDVLRHRNTGEIVEVTGVEPGEDPILSIHVRSSGRSARFYASKFDPAPVEEW